MKLRTEIPKKVKESRKDRKKRERAGGMQSLLWCVLGLPFLGEKRSEENGEEVKR